MKQHHVHIHCTKIILQNSNILPLAHQPCSIFLYESRFSRTKKACNQINFNHFLIFNLIFQYKAGLEPVADRFEATGSAMFFAKFFHGKNADSFLFVLPFF